MFRRANHQNGLVALEASLWCALLLPIGLLGIAFYGLAHDANLVQTIPESLMRETAGKVMTWRSDGDQGFLDVDFFRLNKTLARLSERGTLELARGALKLGEISARACYWVYDVDPASGRVFEPAIASDCQLRGALAGSLSLTTPLANRIRSGVVKPITSSSRALEFVSRVVLFGIALGGKYQGLAEYLRDEVVQHGAVWVPRQELG